MPEENNLNQTTYNNAIDAMSSSLPTIQSLQTINDVVPRPGDCQAIADMITALQNVFTRFCPIA